ncbi:hypothetical protein Cgig2_021830 [Carnegiea gigantea]|uniref:Transposase MuDR plant domain-containing protein n=1 Tax=Carnegiea gigantea TaxID=171969 RepID=A0A9Q1KNF4_9CARY|nr:hypothetical protein Cgig2_021830 [Carnegiea gigantea]
MNNEHVPKWDWEDPIPKSPIPWDKLIKGNSLNEESSDSEYVPKTEDDLEAFENIAAEMDTDGETDGDVPRLLRKKEKPIKVDEHTDFKKLKWQVRMTFGTVQGFKDAISKFAITQGYDLKIGISNSRRRKVGAVCKQGYKFKVYASWDKSKDAWVVRTVNNSHSYIRNMVKNRQLKYT